MNAKLPSQFSAFPNSTYFSRVGLNEWCRPCRKHNTHCTPLIVPLTRLSDVRPYGVSRFSCSTRFVRMSLRSKPDPPMMPTRIADDIWNSHEVAYDQCSLLRVIIIINILQINQSSHKQEHIHRETRKGINALNLLRCWSLCYKKTKTVSICREKWKPRTNIIKQDKKNFRIK